VLAALHVRLAQLLAAVCSAAFAGHAVAAEPAAPASHSFRFEWMEGGGGPAVPAAHMDLGLLVADAAAVRQRRIVVTRRVAVRIDGPGPAVRLAVSLAQDIGAASLRIDGLPVSTVPRVIDPLHRVGASVPHRIEIAVPAGMAPGPFLGQLQWTAESL
jgi:hypothetical protein